VLSSFDETIDCAPADNRLKVRDRKISRGEFSFTPELALTIRIRTISLGREATGVRARRSVTAGAELGKQ
jgi:hypothetical protein